MRAPAALQGMAALFGAIAAFGQVSAPRLGMIQDGAWLRPIYGIAGSAAAGDAFDIGRDLAAVAVSPMQDYALGTAADNGEVLAIVPGQKAAHLTGAGTSPDRIAISPRGSAAALWFASTGRLQIISGLPGSPAIEEIDASFLGGIRAMAVSDDASWVAAVSDAGVYALGSGTIPLPVDGAAALTFFAGSADLIFANSPGVFVLRDFNGNPRISALYSSASALSPVGVAVAPDNSSVAMADASGVIYGIDLERGALAVLDCACSPEGVFPLGSAGFRLTGIASGMVKFFDAPGSRVVVIPSGAAPAPDISSAAAGPIPALSINGLPATATLNQQFTMTITLASPYSSEITGTAMLAFASVNGGDDQTIQFGSGGRSVNFRIPAGATQAIINGQANVAVLTGTVAGTITVTASASGGAPVSATITTGKSAPVIESVTLSQTSGALTVVVTGYTPTREVQSGVFSFSAGSGATLQQGSFTVGLAGAFATWFGSSMSNASGGQFTLTVPFGVQGDSSNVVRVGVNLTNNVGVSNVASSK